MKSEVENKFDSLDPSQTWSFSVKLALFPHYLKDGLCGHFSSEVP